MDVCSPHHKSKSLLQTLHLRRSAGAPSAADALVYLGKHTASAYVVEKGLTTGKRTRMSAFYWRTHSTVRPFQADGLGCWWQMLLHLRLWWGTHFSICGLCNPRSPKRNPCSQGHRPLLDEGCIHRHRRGVRTPKMGEQSGASATKRQTAGVFPQDKRVLPPPASACHKYLRGQRLQTLDVQTQTWTSGRLTTVV